MENEHSRPKKWCMRTSQSKDSEFGGNAHNSSWLEGCLAFLLNSEVCDRTASSPGNVFNKYLLSECVNEWTPLASAVPGSEDSEQLLVDGMIDWGSDKYMSYENQKAHLTNHCSTSPPWQTNSTVTLKVGAVTSVFVTYLDMQKTTMIITTTKNIINHNELWLFVEWLFLCWEFVLSDLHALCRQYLFVLILC